MEAVILGCGDFPKKEYPRELLRRADVIICCDRALDTFLRHRDKIFKDRREPDAIIGDMDSISPKHLKEYSRIAIREEEQETNDQTKAFRYLLEHWPEVKTVHILGATGKREAHTLGNLGQIMEYARLYGASGINCSLLGIGERTGNTPLEAMVMEYAQLRGTLDGMDTTVITELSEYFEKELGYVQPSRTPFVGSNFNVTRAGIHADGLLKNEEIYNIFDTGKFLNRPPLVAVSNTSGLAGIAHWINTYYHLSDDRKIDKNSKLVEMVKEWVDEQYDDGRVTAITDNELVVQITDCCKKLDIVL